MPQVTSTRYTPIFELGRGGMAVVYLAVVRGPGGFNKLQVIKQLKPELAGDPEFLTMFLDEARLSARINHTNVVQTNEVGFDGKNYFIAMEYLDGQSLDAVIRRSTEGTKSLTLPMYLRVLIETLQGLHYAHELKGFDGKDLHVVHRDMSPHNVFLTYDGQVKIVDFGIAKAADSSHETRTGVLKGKVAYMSPEQVGSKTGVDRRSDIFAVGAVLWRVIAGTRMWKGLNEMEILLRVTRGEIPSPTTVRADIPKGLVDICMKALAFEPEHRFQTALEMQEALEKWLDAEGNHTTARESGKIVAALFEDRRKEVTAAIESRLGSSIGDEIASVPQLVQLSIPSALDSGPISSSLPNMTMPNHVTTTAPMPRPMSVPAAAFQTLASSSSRPRDRRLAISLALIVVVVGAGVLWLRRNHEAGMTAAATATTLAPPPLATAPQPATDTVELRLHLTPGSANVFVDDQPFASTMKYPRDGAVHRVRAEAAGYEAQTVVTTFDRDTVDLTFSLKSSDRPDTRRASAPARGRNPDPPATVDNTPPPPPPQPTMTTPPPPPPATTTKKMQIDTDDPWKKKP
jgi:serine/threonine protein kinase